jgi:hypothetical protein
MATHKLCSTVSMANSAIYSVVSAVINRSSPPPFAAPASSKVSELRPTSCRPLEGSGAVKHKPRLVAQQLTDPNLRSVKGSVDSESGAADQSVVSCLD